MKVSGNVVILLHFIRPSSEENTFNKAM